MNQRTQPRQTEKLGATEMKFPNRKPTHQAVFPPQAKKSGPGVMDLDDPAVVAQLRGQHVAPKSASETDSRFLDVTLPSNFYFYPFKTLSLRFIRGGEQAKFARAAKDGRIKHVVDAISATLAPGVSAYDLTMKDFYWIMHYQRMNSNKKIPYIHKTYCENAEHLTKVLSKELPEESLEISQIITDTTLKDTPFDPTKIVMPSFAEHIQVGTVRMRDIVEVAENDEREDFEEFSWLADRAAFIEPQKGAETIADRIKVVQQLSSEEMDELQKYMDSVSTYGVQEFIVVKCKECGAEKVSEVTIDALSFLPTH